VINPLKSDAFITAEVVRIRRYTKTEILPENIHLSVNFENFSAFCVTSMQLLEKYQTPEQICRFNHSSQPFAKSQSRQILSRQSPKFFRHFTPSVFLTSSHNTLNSLFKNALKFLTANQRAVQILRNFDCSVEVVAQFHRNFAYIFKIKIFVIYNRLVFNYFCICDCRIYSPLLMMFSPKFENRVTIISMIFVSVAATMAFAKRKNFSIPTKKFLLTIVATLYIFYMVEVRSLHFRLSSEMPNRKNTFCNSYYNKVKIRY